MSLSNSNMTVIVKTFINTTFDDSIKLNDFTNHDSPSHTNKNLSSLPVPVPNPRPLVILPSNHPHRPHLNLQQPPQHIQLLDPVPIRPIKPLSILIIK